MYVGAGVFLQLVTILAMMWPTENSFVLVRICKIKTKNNVKKKFQHIYKNLLTLIAKRIEINVK